MTDDQQKRVELIQEWTALELFLNRLERYIEPLGKMSDRDIYEERWKDQISSTMARIEAIRKHLYSAN